MAGAGLNSCTATSRSNWAWCPNCCQESWALAIASWAEAVPGTADAAIANAKVSSALTARWGTDNVVIESLQRPVGELTAGTR